MKKYYTSETAVQFADLTEGISWSQSDCNLGHPPQIKHVTTVLVHTWPTRFQSQLIFVLTLIFLYTCFASFCLALHLLSFSLPVLHTLCIFYLLLHLHPIPVGIAALSSQLSQFFCGVFPFFFCSVLGIIVLSAFLAQDIWLIFK